MASSFPSENDYFQIPGDPSNTPLGSSGNGTHTHNQLHVENGKSLQAVQESVPRLSHDHSGADPVPSGNVSRPTPKLKQVNTHLDPDTDLSDTSLHHTLGNTEFKAASGSHSHTLSQSGFDSPLNDIRSPSGLQVVAPGVGITPDLYFKSVTGTLTRQSESGLPYFRLTHTSPSRLDTEQLQWVPTQWYRVSFFARSPNGASLKISIPSQANTILQNSGVLPTGWTAYSFDFLPAKAVGWTALTPWRSGVAIENLIANTTLEIRGLSVEKTTPQVSTASFTLNGSGYSAGVAYLDTVNHAITATTGVSFCSVRLGSNLSRITFSKNGIYTLNLRVRMGYHASPASNTRSFVEINEWRAGLLTTVDIQNRVAGYGYEDIWDLSLVDTRLRVGDELSFGSYSSSQAYSLLVADCIGLITLNEELP